MSDLAPIIIEWDTFEMIEQYTKRGFCANTLSAIGPIKIYPKPKRNTRRSEKLHRRECRK